MKEHGNLYWEIDFYLLDEGCPGTCGNSRVSVCDYGYAGVFMKARAFYECATKNGMRITGFSQVLRHDTTGENRAHHVYAMWYLADNTNAGMFFNSTPETAFKALRRCYFRK